MIARKVKCAASMDVDTRALKDQVIKQLTTLHINMIGRYQVHDG